MGEAMHTAVCGLGWGDEGKGKIVDLLCPSFDLVVRYNGGANAGHTVCVDGERFALHLLPTGVLRPSVRAVIGPGVVVDPIQLLSEVDALTERGLDVLPRLFISDRAHLVLAYHKVEDRLSEQAAGEGGRIGTTARGIGPCYADKMRRWTAFRVGDLLYDDDLENRVRTVVAARRTMFSAVYGDDGGLDVEAVLTELRAVTPRLKPCITDTTALLHEALDAGQALLFEGANGVLLDVDHGTYPFVTSSSTGPYGIGAGAGVPPGLVTCVVGVVKAYATRVGSGPFVAELKDATGDRIRERGHEFGTTTGRPRRCGWFDAVSTRYSAQVSGVTELALVHLDTLSGFERVGICTAYRLDGVTLTTPPADPRRLARTEPVVEFVPGWSGDLGKVRLFEDLPEAARSYLARIEHLVGVPVAIAGVGPERSQVLVRGRLAALTKTLETTST